MKQDNKPRAGILPVSTWKQCKAHLFYSTLTERAKAIYKTKCEEFLATGLLSALYLDTLILYARESDALATLDEKIAAEGTTVSYTDRYGRLKVVPHPDVKTRKEKLASILEISKRLGYSPRDVRAFGKEGEPEAKTGREILEDIRRGLDMY